MHISLLTDGIYPYLMGGMQKHSYYLAKHLAQKGVYVDIYHAIPENQTIPIFKNEYSHQELQFIRLIPIPFPTRGKYPGHYILESYVYSQRVYKEFQKQELVDFVYIQGFSGWELIMQLSNKSQKNKNHIPIGINFHGVEMFQKAPSLRVKLEHLLLRPFVKINLRNADFVFSLGGQLTSIHKSLISCNNIIELPIGITPDWINDNPKQNPPRNLKFVFIGRYERRKGIEELNDVLQLFIAEECISFECHFIGPIPKEKQILNQNNLIYHGATHEEAKIKEILKNSDVLLCPSWSEGMPTVILEAMASGCAIIATDVGAVSEQVDETNGSLINVGNKSELKQAIEKMLSMPPVELRKMKLASIEKIKRKFLWENVIEETISVIKKIADTKKYKAN